MPSRRPKPTSLGVPKRSLAHEVDYWAVIYTACGDIKINLLEQKAPNAVANFVYLARKGYYDGLAWMRVVGDFLIHSGDPNDDLASPPDGPGYTLHDQVAKSQAQYRFGAVGFVNMGEPGYFGSQFFVIAHDLAGALKDDPEPAIEGEGRNVLFGQVPQRFYGSVHEITRYETEGAVSAAAFIERIEIVKKHAGRNRSGGRP